MKTRKKLEKKTKWSRWSQRCIDNGLKLWSSDIFAHTFLQLNDVVFNFTDIVLGLDFFRDTLDLVKDFCNGSVKPKAWPKEKECFAKYQELRRLPGYFNALRKICKIAQIEKVAEFEKEYMKLISRHCIFRKLHSPLGGHFTS
jgi:hypothetical protein